MQTEQSGMVEKVTQYHYVDHIPIETSRRVATLHEDLPNVVQLMSDIPFERSAMNPMATESERKVLP